MLSSFSNILINTIKDKEKGNNTNNKTNPYGGLKLEDESINESCAADSQDDKKEIDSECSFFRLHRMDERGGKIKIML